MIEPQKKFYNLLIVDDHEIVRTGLTLMLQNARLNDRTFVTMEAKSGEEALQLLISREIDIALIDYNLPGLKGDEVISRVLLYKPKQKIIVISNYDEEIYITTALNAGAFGYALKDIGLPELLSGIEMVLSGKRFIPLNVNVKLLEAEINEKLKLTNSKKIFSEYGLTLRESQIITLISKEFTNEEIGEKLFISKRTVDAHRHNILNKLHLKNTAGLIKFAIANKLT